MIYLSPGGYAAMIEIIRVTAQDQLQDCFAIRKKVFVEEQQVSEDLEIDEKDDSPSACHHMLLMYDGKPAAASRWYSYNEQTAKLQRVAVLIEHRGKGLGKSIIQAMEEHARELGYAATILDGQCQAEAFYLKLGYVTISQEPFYDAGILHVRMQKQL
jgi:predicted GNAT family N-acyltransferase